ncbi:MAG: rRNA maturation RNase YbeY [Immundisolibacteraceae bacterium]|nr:rRNA maturation RNase YbeY [Immundisolibacteraceae bacterium]
MARDLTVQLAVDTVNIPSDQQFNQWVNLARQGCGGEITLRVVDEPESAQLNSQFRDKSGPTNVLSFDAQALAAEQQSLLPPELVAELANELGDLVICAPLVTAEAAQQGKELVCHWAHLTMHGVLHLRGYDHQDDAEQQQMEAIEIDLLKQLGYADPYTLEQSAND